MRAPSPAMRPELAQQHERKRNRHSENCGDQRQAEPDFLTDGGNRRINRGHRRPSFVVRALEHIAVARATLAGV